MARKLEKYEILEEIGHGGMATVFRARDSVLDRLVALKVMHPHLRSAEEARRRFHREAKSVARLRHPRVLEIYDFSGVGSDEAFIAAELLTGPTLKAFREARRELPAEIAACFVIEIARALEAAHDAGIVHRDVKPENVLLHEDRDLKLTDFGIADMVDAQSMTATGQILGSPGHMAPEQIEGRDCDGRTDLFSLGTVLYYLATGRLPFTGRNPHQVLKKIMDGDYADPLRLTPAIGEGLRAIIVRSLATDPADRFQTAAELREALEAWVAAVGIDDPAVTLAAYLGDPEVEGERLRQQTIAHLIAAGTEASDDGDVARALDAYNRVLAIDDGNEEVLRLVQRVGRQQRHRAVLVGGVGLAAVGLLAASGAWALWPGPEEATALEPPRPVAMVSAPAPVAAAPDAGGASAEPGASSDAGPDGGPPDAGAAVARRPARGPRRVRVTTRPEAVWVSVDEEDAQRRTSGFEVSLTPGSHDIAIRAGGCGCLDLRAATLGPRPRDPRAWHPIGAPRGALPALRFDRLFGCDRPRSGRAIGRELRSGGADELRLRPPAG